MNVDEMIENDQPGLLLEIDNKTLKDWGQKLDNIKTFLSKHIDTKENAVHLLYLISQYEMACRTRTRVYTARWLLREI